ncbi:MAG: squalene/phytoene synthase family protein, partial [Candidatus Paceibacteria bacterium]
MSQSIEQAYKVAQQTARKAGGPFLFATLFTRLNTQLELQALMAFFSAARNIVTPRVQDTMSLEERQREFGKWMYRWQVAYENITSDDPYLWTAADVFNRYEIPVEYGTQVLNAMQTHVSYQGTYETTDEFYTTFLGIGGSIAQVVGYVYGVADTQNLRTLRYVGQGVQLTQILTRSAHRKKCPLPQDVQTEYDVDIADIFSTEPSKNAKAYLSRYVEEARGLLNELHSLIPKLTEGTMSALFIFAFHQALLDKLVKRDYVIGQDGVTLSVWERMKVVGYVI